MQNEEAMTPNADDLENGYELHQLRKSIVMLAMDLCHARSAYRSLERIADSMSDGNRILVRKIDELEAAANEAGERLVITMKEKAELSESLEAALCASAAALTSGMVTRDDTGTVVGIHFGGRYFTRSDPRNDSPVNDICGCLAKRQPGEPIFVLLGRDPEGAMAIRFWADRRGSRSFEDQSFVFESRKVNEAREIADSFDKWRIEHGSSAKTPEPRRAIPRRPED